MDAYSAQDDQEEVERSTSTILDKPKRCLTAYNFFFQQERRRLLASLPDRKAPPADRASSEDTTESKAKKKTAVHGKIGFADLAKTISAKWKAITDSEREIYLALAAKDKKRYTVELKDWKGLMKRLAKQEKAAKRNKKEEEQMEEEDEQEEDLGAEAEDDSEQADLQEYSGSGREIEPILSLPQTYSAAPPLFVPSSYSGTLSYGGCFAPLSPPRPSLGAPNGGFEGGIRANPNMMQSSPRNLQRLLALALSATTEDNPAPVLMGSAGCVPGLHRLAAGSDSLTALLSGNWTPQLQGTATSTNLPCVMMKDQNPDSDMLGRCFPDAGSLLSSSSDPISCMNRNTQGPQNVVFDSSGASSLKGPPSELLPTPIGVQLDSGQMSPVISVRNASGSSLGNLAKDWDEETKSLFINHFRT